MILFLENDGSILIPGNVSNSCHGLIRQCNTRWGVDGYFSQTWLYLMIQIDATVDVTRLGREC